MKAPLLIYGAGGLGRELLSLLNACSDFEVTGFVDDTVLKDTVVKGIKVLGGIEVIRKAVKPVNVILAFGDPAVKAARVNALAQYDVRYPVIIHPSAVLQDASAITIGVGSVICAGTVMTTDIIVGEHVLINLNCTVGHDSRIGSRASLMPGVHVGGEVVIGDEVLVGAGTTILNRLNLGARCKIGMGSVVIRDIESGDVVAGVPARRIKSEK
ncbi:MAG TPA: acetyltransferase [Chryseolinea sp.]|nr:acetyltransferase [Chryseolinea sp.]